MAYNEIGPIQDLRAALETRGVGAYTQDERVRLSKPVGAIAGGLVEPRPPLQDYGSEIRLLKANLYELRDKIDKIGEELHKRIERLEMLVGS